MIVCLGYIGGILDHHCLELIFAVLIFVDFCDYHCLEVIIRFVDIAGIVVHHPLEVIV